MPQSSSSSAGAIYLDKHRRIEDLRQAIWRAGARLPSISRVILFGSLVSGIPTPRSDADLLVVVTHSRHQRAADRVPELLGAMAPLPCPVDLFVVTADELERAQREQSPLVREALTTGLDLL